MGPMTVVCICIGSKHLPHCTPDLCGYCNLTNPGISKFRPAVLKVLLFYIIERAFSAQ